MNWTDLVWVDSKGGRYDIAHNTDAVLHSIVIVWLT